MNWKPVYLLLTALGAVVPYIHFIPWVREHGLDMPLFFHQLHANGVSEFFAADVFVSAIVVIAFLIAERHLLRSRWWLPVLGLVLFGVSVALPLLLYLRQTAVRSQPDPGAAEATG